MTNKLHAIIEDNLTKTQELSDKLDAFQSAFSFLAFELETVCFDSLENHEKAIDDLLQEALDLNTNMRILKLLQLMKMKYHAALKAHKYSLNIMNEEAQKSARLIREQQRGVRNARSTAEAFKEIGESKGVH